MSDPIWFHPQLQIADVQHLSPNTLGEYLGMEWVEIGPDYLIMRMPVDHRTHQPYGLLHGGASVALAETIGSIGAALCIDHQAYIAVGQEINANHLRSIRNGYVYATARPLHRGGSSHVWEIHIRDEHQHLVCVSRITVAILKRKDR